MTAKKIDYQLAFLIYKGFMLTGFASWEINLDLLISFPTDHVSDVWEPAEASLMG